MLRTGEISAQSLRQLRRMAGRWARTVDEADDLVQDTLIAALEVGRDFDSPQFFAWASAVLKRRALFVARTAGRRRRRDMNFAMDAADSVMSVARERRLPRRFIDSLPPSVRTIALLINAGLGREEIASALGISDLALRQRISSLRKAWKLFDADTDFDEPPFRAQQPCGLRRRSLKTMLVQLPSAQFAIADPDGHKIFLGIAHNSSARGN